jgi:hypothetical protein
MIPRAAACLALLVPLVAAAADVREGRRLVESSKCESCHQQKVRGPIGEIYLRKDRRVDSWKKLRTQVARCNTDLDLALFPEDEDAISAYLNATYYRFPQK